MAVAALTLLLTGCAGTKAAQEAAEEKTDITTINPEEDTISTIMADLEKDGWKSENEAPENEDGIAESDISQLIKLEKGNQTIKLFDFYSADLAQETLENIQMYADSDETVKKDGNLLTVKEEDETSYYVLKDTLIVYADDVPDALTLFENWGLI
jgi:outer membrane protein OmpA-like peptidoglycan-associated protein